MTLEPNAVLRLPSGNVVRVLFAHPRASEPAWLCAYRAPMPAARREVTLRSGARQTHPP
jgi:hypothetical protein